MERVICDFTCACRFYLCLVSFHFDLYLGGVVFWRLVGKLKRYTDSNRHQLTGLSIGTECLSISDGCGKVVSTGCKKPRK